MSKKSDILSKDELVIKIKGILEKLGLEKTYYKVSNRTVDLSKSVDENLQRALEAEVIISGGNMESNQEHCFKA